jgi:hypothetical protein
MRPLDVVALTGATAGVNVPLPFAPKFVFIFNTTDGVAACSSSLNAGATGLALGASGASAIASAGITIGSQGVFVGASALPNGKQGILVAIG